MVRVIRDFLKIPETVFSTQEILDVCGVLNVNAHDLPVTPTPVQALYANISILEHSFNAFSHFIARPVHSRCGPREKNGLWAPPKDIF